MQSLMSNFGAIVLWIGVVDAVVILLLGIAAATIQLFKVDIPGFYNRILPSVAILVGTSVASGVVMMVARWVSRLVA